MIGGLDSMQSELNIFDWEYRVAQTVDRGEKANRTKLILNGGVDETRTRGLMRDRHAF
jgi:hypothetical protein